LRVQVALALAALVVGCGPPDEARQVAWPEFVPDPPERVHVVLVLIDTLRADRLGIYGYEDAVTPNIEALARESVFFERAFAAAPWTLPSVVSMMTSRLPLEHRVTARGDVVSDSVKIIPEYFQDLGYRTAGFVTNPYGSVTAGLVRGYDFLAPQEAREHTVDLQALGTWLDDRGSEPQFLYLHSTEPHLPYKAPDEYREHHGQVPRRVLRGVHQDMAQMRSLSRQDFEDGLPLGTTDTDAGQQEAIDSLAGKRRQIDALYDSGVSWADANVGAVVELLKQRGMWDDTLLILVSDHGEELYDHGGWLHHQTLYDELLHVPMLVHFPGMDVVDGEAAVRCETPVSLIDVLPTLLDYLGATANDLRGVSLLQLLGEEQSAPRVVSNRLNRMLHHGVGFELRGNTNVAVVTGHWKGIWNIEPDTFELYRTDLDPGETQDLAHSEGERAVRLKAFAQSWFAARATEEEAQQLAVSPEELKRLRALGYAR